MLAASLMVALFWSAFSGISLDDGVGDVETNKVVARKSRDGASFMMRLWQWY